MGFYGSGCVGSAKQLEEDGRGRKMQRKGEGKRYREEKRERYRVRDQGERGKGVQRKGEGQRKRVEKSEAEREFE